MPPDPTPARQAAPSVAVLLAACNGVRYLAEQLHSILCQRGVAVRIFVSVDHSSDGTEECAARLCQSDRRVTLLPCGSIFGSATANFFRLVREVDFEPFDFVALSDQDDIWLPDKLQRAVTALDASQAEAFSSSVIAFWEGGEKKYINKAHPQRQWDYLFETAGPGCTYVLRTPLVAEFRTFIKLNHERVRSLWSHDRFIYAFARSRRYKWLIDDHPGIMYRQHALNTLGANVGFDALLTRTKLIFESRIFNQCLLTAQLTGVDSTPFVAKWSKARFFGLLWLASQARHCRRNPSEQVYFSILISTLALVSLIRSSPAKAR